MANVLSFQQIMDLWNAAGGDPGWAPLMAGIAMAESSGDPTVLNNNPSTGDYSVGLWQINYYNGLAASRTAKYGSPTALLNSDQLQARAAVDLAGGGGNGLGPWRTDRAWDQWANAGFPSKPSVATVQQWLKNAGVPTGTGPGSGTVTDPSSVSGLLNPATSGSGNAPGGGQGAKPGNDLGTCVIQFPGFLFFSGPCLLTKGGVKWLSGVACLVAGAGVFTFGVVMLAAWGLDQSGAKGAITSTARKVGIGGALLTGQPEIAAGIAAGTKGSKGGAAKGARSSSPKGSRSSGSASSGEPRDVGRLGSWQIERRFRELQRQTGPIGPRGASESSRRAAAPKSVPGPGRRPGAEQRARAQERARGRPRTVHYNEAGVPF